MAIVAIIATVAVVAVVAVVAIVATVAVACSLDCSLASPCVGVKISKLMVAGKASASGVAVAVS